MRDLFVCLIVSATVPLMADVRGTVSIDLDRAELRAQLQYDYSAVADGGVVKLLLNPAFEVRSVTCKTCGAFHLERDGDDPAALVIELTKPMAKGDVLPLSIDYGGSVVKSYLRDEEFLELGLDDFWYPVHPRIGEITFRYDLRVTVNKPGFRLVSNGTAKRDDDGWPVKSRVPDIDIDLILGKHLETVHDTRSGYDLAVVTQNLPAEFPKRILTGIRDVLDFYNSTFGVDNRQRAVTAVFRPVVSREGQGGYFRKGYFVLPKLTDPEAALPPIAHELAHYWFIHAGQENAWLNESFAEYSAMMAMRRLRSPQEFERILEEKRKRVASASLPPIYQFDRTKNRRAAPAVMYVKGPLALHALEQELGSRRFISLLKRMIHDNVIDADQLIALVREISSERVAVDFLQLLKS